MYRFWFSYLHDGYWHLSEWSTLGACVVAMRAKIAAGLDVGLDWSAGLGQDLAVRDAAGRAGLAYIHIS